jgi:hypothetical protein
MSIRFLLWDFSLALLSHPLSVLLLVCPTSAEFHGMTADTPSPQAFRCLTAFFGTCPQVTVRTGSTWIPAHRLKFKTMQGLYVVTDIYPFHLQARKVELVLTDSDGC